MGFSVMSDAVQLPDDEPDEPEPAAAVLPGAGAEDAAGAAVDPEAEEGAVTFVVELGSAADVAVVVGAVTAPDPAPARVAIRMITTTTTSTRITTARRRQYTERGCEPTGCLNADMRPG